jgi:hypothetical protein
MQRLKYLRVIVCVTYVVASIAKRFYAVDSNPEILESNNYHGHPKSRTNACFAVLVEYGVRNVIVAILSLKHCWSIPLD